MLNKKRRTQSPLQCSSIAARVCRVLPEAVPPEPDVMVVDPPRAGLSKKVVKYMLGKPIRGRSFMFPVIRPLWRVMWQ